MAGVLDLTVFRVAVNFNPLPDHPVCVCGALGWSMVALGLLSRLPVRVLAVLQRVDHCPAQPDGWG